MKKIFSLPTWLVFGVGLVLLISASVASIFSFEARLTTGVLLMLGTFLYPFAIVHALNDKSKVKHDVAPFNVCWILGVIGAILLVIAQYIFEQDEIDLGLPGFIFIAVLVYVYLFTARFIKVMELRKEVQYSDCILLAMGLMFFPFNILFVHNRVKKIILSYNTVEAV